MSVVGDVPWELLAAWFYNVSVFEKYHAVIDILYLSAVVRWRRIR
jgi:hypothetical protein